MKYITIKILLLAAIMPLFASCDDHVAIDTSTHIGHILCDVVFILAELGICGIGLNGGIRGIKGGSLGSLTKLDRGGFLNLLGILDGRLLGLLLLNGSRSHIVFQCIHVHRDLAGSRFGRRGFRRRKTGRSRRFWQTQEARRGVNS